MANVLAIDLGASSGRGILYRIEGGKLVGEEVHRFPNGALREEGGWFWDTEGLLREVKRAIREGARRAKLDGIGIDTWGVDYGWITRDGNLARPVRHYRDARTDEASKRCDVMSAFEQFEIAGIAPNDYNTDYQLWAESKTRGFCADERLLFIPNLLGYFLTGELASEPCIASTSGFYRNGVGFDPSFCEKIGLPLSALPPVLPTGSCLGKLNRETERETGATDARVFLVPGHDTAAAVLALPAREKNPLFLSSGTWSLFGVELSASLFGREAFEAGYTNEIGYGNTVRFLKNIMGLWLAQECRAAFYRAGAKYTWEEMEALARQANGWGLIDVCAPEFNRASDMPGAIRTFVKTHSGRELHTHGEILRTVYESLALEYRLALEGLEKTTGEKYETLYVIGGGSNNDLLNQLSADALGIRVTAGGAEATSMGNALAQLIALGVLKNTEQARKLVRESVALKEYTPHSSREREGALAQYRALKGRA